MGKKKKDNYLWIGIAVVAVVVLAIILISNSNNASKENTYNNIEKDIWLFYCGADSDIVNYYCSYYDLKLYPTSENQNSTTINGCLGIKAKAIQEEVNEKGVVQRLKIILDNETWWIDDINTNKETPFCEEDSDCIRLIKKPERCFEEPEEVYCDFKETLFETDLYYKWTYVNTDTCVKGGCFECLEYSDCSYF